jgi:hypothetical protein
MAKVKFLKSGKQIKKDAPEALLNGAINGATTVGVMFGATNLKISKDDAKNTKIKKWFGPIALAVGLSIKATVEQEQFVEIGNGMISAGSLLTAGNLVVPAHKEKLGLSGVDQMGATQKDAIDYNTLVQSAVKEAMNGLNDSPIIPVENVFLNGSEFENQAVPVEDIF